MKFALWLALATLTYICSIEMAMALPAFAIREKVSCTMCHTNGAFPHLTRMGYLYRRAAFRFPSDIGNEEKDNETFDLTHHMAAGANIDYEYTDTKTQGSAHTITNNNISVREVEIWPLIGAFHGNIGAWTEVDFSPETDQGAASAQLNQGDMRYVWGSSDKFFNLRAGLIAPEGYGASDQWLDDGNIPTMDQVTAFYNQDTLITPFGAMETPQMGAEFGYNTDKSFVTLGILNGINGSLGTAEPATVKAGRKSVKDYKLQWDLFINENFAITAAHYIGNVSLSTLDGSGNVWYDAFQSSRFYLSYYPNSDVEVLTGISYGDYQYVTPASGVFPVGHFQNRGGFLGSIYHVRPHFSLGARWDYATQASGFSDNPSSTPMVRGFGLMASLPYEHTNFVFHLQYQDTNNFQLNGQHVTQNSLDGRAEWRLLF